MRENDHDDFGGLQRDLLATGRAMPRRDALLIAAKLGVSAGALQLLGCGGDAGSPTSPGTTTATTLAASGSCSRIPEETAGPFPGDGSNGPNVLSAAGVVRGDIRSSFAGLSGTAEGVPLTVELTIVSASSCAPLAGRAVYIWHCDRAGRYSLYDSALANQNYLRGVQQADASGRVAFTTVFPGCYSGRWPHIHFEVFPSLSTATSAASRIATSQIALPKEACDAVYTTNGYQTSVTNLSRVTLASDNVFSDGSALELATITGDVGSGLRAALSVAVAA